MINLKKNEKNTKRYSKLKILRKIKINIYIIKNKNSKNIKT